ncbi:hypothetical protein ACJMK2_032649 [Sinanodonta woodiana]
MDFETSEWNVPSDADGLTASLFGKIHGHKMKKKKGKIQGLHDIGSNNARVKKEQKISVDNQLKVGIMSKLEGKKLKMQRRKLKKLIVQHRDQGVSASKRDNNDCMMCGDDRDADNLKSTKDNGLPSVKRKRNEMEISMQDNDISLLPRKKARTNVNSGLLPVDVERSKSDKSFNDRNVNETLKRKKQSENHTVDLEDNSEKKKKKRKRKSKKNKFKVDSPVKRDEHLSSISSEEGFSTNMKMATNQSLSEIIHKNLDGDVKDEEWKRKKRRKSQTNNLKADSEKKNDKQFPSSISIRELNSNMESNIKCLTASVPKQKEISPRINKNEIGQRLIKSSDTIFPVKPSKSHKNSPFNVEKLNSILDNKHAGTKASKGNVSDKGSNIKDHKRSENAPTSSASLKEKMLERLSAARFRYLNEQLYTTTGEKAFQLFQEDADSFAVYHTGFQGQVEKWPTNPVDLIIKFIMSRPKHLIIADFGCGDAKIARSVPNKVYSFDLAALNEYVTVCNMAKVPLTDRSVDMAVFCLSLMGTNLADYLREAHRVLKNGGSLKIAEVQSRFQNLGAFIKRVEMLGFKLTNQDAENKMFIMIDFKKSKPAKSRGSSTQLTLDPCIYKKR